MEKDSLYFPRENTETIIEKIVDKNIVKYSKYLKGIIIGKGAFAKCYVFKKMSNGKLYAGKVIDRSELLKRNKKLKLNNEINIHRSLEHPNIVRFRHTFEDNNFVYIILELCKNQTMMELVKRNKRLTESETRFYIVQLISVLKYLKSEKIVHRDLKLGNLFLDHEMNLKVGDFGLATRLSYDKEKKHTVCGTPNYIAPEVLDQSAGHSYAADLWSLGVIIYTVVIGRPPFESHDLQTTYNRIKSNQYSFPDHILISEKCKSLIRLILNNDPEARPDVNDLQEHSFFITSESQKLAQETLNQSQAAPLEERAKLLEEEDEAPNKKPVTEEQIEDNDNIVEEPKKISGKHSLGKLSGKKKSQLLATQKNVKRDTYSVMHSTLEFSIENRKLPAILLTLPSPPLSNYQLWVTHICDYTKKYGFGYMMSNTNIGIYFNDGSKLILNMELDKVEYYERGSNDPQKFDGSHFPDSLYKKKQLLSHFKNYFLNEYSRNSRVSISEECAFPYKVNEPMVYVKKYIKSRHAFLLRLSNQSLQVSFFEGSELLLTHESRVVTYINTNGYKQTSYLTDILLKGDCPELIKRLNYTKELLRKLINDPAIPSAAISKTSSSSSSSSK